MPEIAPSPLVSIGIPTYNRARFLSRSLESALNQSHSHIEVIVSDNASFDETEDLCRKYAASDRRVRYFRQNENVGPTRNFNATLDVVRGEYFMWLADDDWLDSNYVACCLSRLHADPAVIAAAGRAKLYAENSEFQERDISINLLQATPQARVLAYYAQVTYNSLFYGLTKSEILRKIGLENTLAGDWKTVSVLALHGKLITVEETSIHRMAAGTSQSFKSTIRTLRLPAYQAYFPRIIIAYNSSKSIFSSDVIAHLPLFPRLQLALKIFAILMLRYSWMKRFIPRRMRKLFVANYH